MAQTNMAPNDSIRGELHRGIYNTNLFLGLWHTGQDQLAKFDPYITGYSYIYWTALPKFLTSGSPLVDKTWAVDWKTLTQSNFKSFDGISDIQLDAEELTAGMNGRTMAIPSNSKFESTSYTMKFQEMTGSRLRELAHLWVTGIRDPETGFASYHGNTSLPYSMANHTAELLYMVTDPGGQKIEFACYLTNLMPTKVPMSHLNYSSGEHSLAEFDIEFRGNYHQSVAINALAVKVITSFGVKQTHLDYGSSTVTEAGPTGTATVTKKIDFAEALIGAAQG